VNDKLQRMWKEVVVAQLHALSWSSPGESEENHEERNSVFPVSGPKFEPRTSLTRSRIANHSTTTSVGVCVCVCARARVRACCDSGPNLLFNDSKKISHLPNFSVYCRKLMRCYGNHVSLV
jgi:hypothetical protein